MTPEQKARYEELLNKENLTDDEKTELADLEALLPEDPEQDEFDQAWDDLDGDTSTADDSTADDGALTDGTDDSASDDNADGTGDASQQTDNGSDASTPNNDSDSQASDTDDDDDDDDAAKEETPEQKIARLEAENQQLNHKMSSWDGRLKKEAQLRKAAEDKLKTKDSDGSDDVTPEDEDDKELKDFFEEYPDLEKPIKKVAEKIATKIVEKRVGNVEQNVEQLSESQQADADKKHISAIEEAHPDWETIYKSGALTKWIKKQPAILQPRYEEIVDSGNSGEVIAMFTQYKKATGKQTKEETDNSNSSSQSEGKKQKLKDLEAVPSTNNPPNTSGKGGMPKKDDFDGAWDHFTKDEK